MVRQLPSSACGKIRLKLIQLNFRQGRAGQPATNRRQIRVVKMQSKWRTANAINCEICCWINSAQSAECRMRYTLQCVGKAKLSHSFATLSTPTNWRQRVFASLAISAENIFKKWAELVKSQFVGHVSACRRVAVSRCRRRRCARV